MMERPVGASTNEVTSIVIRFICLEGYFRLHREVEACSLVCKDWRDQLVEYPVDDIRWRDRDWVLRKFGAGKRPFWRLRTLKLTVPAGATRNDGPVRFVHRFQPELDSPFQGIQHTLIHLRSLSLSQEICENFGLQRLKHCTKLTSLQLGSCSKHGSLDFLCNMTRLKSLQIFQAETLQDISVLSESCSDLKHLVLRHAGLIENLDGIRYCKKIEKVDFTGAVALRNIEALNLCFHLKEAVFTRCSNLRCIDPLEACDSLEILYLGHCQYLTNIRALRNKIHLKSLWLNNCTSLGNIHELASCCSLTTLSIGYCPRLSTPEQLLPLLQCPNLRELYALGLTREIFPSRGNLQVCTEATTFSMSILQDRNQLGRRHHPFHLTL